MDKNLDGFVSSIIEAFLGDKNADIIDLMAHIDCVVAKFLGEIDEEDPIETKRVIKNLTDLSQVFLSRSLATLQCIKHIAGLQALEMDNIKECIRQSIAKLEE